MEVATIFVLVVIVGGILLHVMPPRDPNPGDVMPEPTCAHCEALTREEEL